MGSSFAATVSKAPSAVEIDCRCEVGENIITIGIEPRKNAYVDWRRGLSDDANQQPKDFVHRILRFDAIHSRILCAAKLKPALDARRPYAESTFAYSRNIFRFFEMYWAEKVVSGEVSHTTPRRYVDHNIQKKIIINDIRPTHLPRHPFYPIFLFLAYLQQIRGFLCSSAAPRYKTRAIHFL